MGGLMFVILYRRSRLVLLIKISVRLAHIVHFVYLPSYISVLMNTGIKCTHIPRKWVQVKLGHILFASTEHTLFALALTANLNINHQPSLKVTHQSGKNWPGLAV